MEENIKMRKTAIIALTALLALGIVLPAMAADLDVSGYFRTRGFYLSKAGTTLAETEKSDAYYDFRLRPVLKFKVNDKLYITSRVAIFDNKFGEATGARYTEGNTDGKSDVAAWQHGWATWISDYGKLDIGRMKGGVFGLGLFEDEKVVDRIIWSVAVGSQDQFGDRPLGLLGIIEKNRDMDSNGSLSDNDYDAFYLGGIYKNQALNKDGNKETVQEAGLLFGLIRDEGSYGPGTAATTKTYYLVNPYWDLKKLADGNLGFKGEVQFRTGAISSKTGGADEDISAMGFGFAGTYDFGQFDLELGYVSTSGDDNTGDTEYNSLANSNIDVGNNGLGTEWTPLVVLQDVNGLVKAGGESGVSLIYLIGNYQVNKDVKVTGVFGNATPNAGSNTEPFGNEIDLKLNWKLTDQLNYFFNLGYLMSGDFFKTATTEPESVHTIYHGIEFDF
jgi:hypothetical protein